MTTATRIALVQIDDYDPWPATPESRRETDPQSLQPSLFADFPTFVRAHDGDAFYSRFDDMFAVTGDKQPETGSETVGHIETGAETVGHVETGIELQVGVGRGQTARAAGGEIKDTFEQRRAIGARIRGAAQLLADD